MLRKSIKKKIRQPNSLNFELWMWMWMKEIKARMLYQVWPKFHERSLNQMIAQLPWLKEKRSSRWMIRVGYHLQLRSLQRKSVSIASYFKTYCIKFFSQNTPIKLRYPMLEQGTTMDPRFGPDLLANLNLIFRMRQIWVGFGFGP